ncbi:hypothetical protein EW026_g7748 [Hermanssonia centrifuga]|uniref:Uncharacterized protein n=1 Tax=Hermanssonia centrifuga TaxID=98765 RepID=A0A4S4K6S9_9APHY|nr:hypothetical protein EW026_g7748 [Hermanssonia centrifuga]
MFLRYAIGVHDRTYKDNKILSGMVEACMIVEDKEKRGVGMQGFRWDNANLTDYDRMLHILYIESPAAYRHFSKYLPARTERSFQIMEGKAPKMPMTICDRSFELVAQELQVLKYDGPVALSWDDTKLLPVFRLCWDPEQKAHFLIGAVKGPIRVADPEMARTVADDASHVLGTKVRLFCLQIPLAAATLRFIIERHPEYLGDIIFLFVFGELPDAYQNQQISHLERIKIVLRAHYFVRMWQSFLHKAGYPESRANLPDDNADTEKIIRAQEREEIHAQIDLIIPDVDVIEEEKPFGKGSFSTEELDLGFLVTEREKHQTRQAERGTRTGVTQAVSSEEPTNHSVRHALLKGIQAVLREKQDRGTSTGKNREARWHEGGTSVSSKTAGNSANAAVVSASAAKDALKRREKLFRLAQVPLLNLIKHAQISAVRAIKVTQYGIIYGEDTFGVAIGRVEALYAKSGGKNAKHGSVETSDSIGALSHIAVQVYEYMYGRKFRAIPQATSALQLGQFWMLPPLSFLCLLVNTPERSTYGLTLSEKDEAIFRELHNSAKTIKTAMVLSRKRGKNAIKIDVE